MAMGVKRLQVHTDSQLVMCQILREYEARLDQMTTYQDDVKKSQVDSLARLATMEGPVDMREVTITKLTLPSTNYSLVTTLDAMKITR